MLLFPTPLVPASVQADFQQATLDFIEANARWQALDPIARRERNLKTSKVYARTCVAWQDSCQALYRIRSLCESYPALRVPPWDTILDLLSEDVEVVAWPHP